ncbi:MAG: VanZ family protein [Candidatus Hydrothermarchaeales archaeon]
MNRTLSYWGPVISYAGVIFYLSSIPFLTPPALGGIVWVQIDPDQLILHLFEYSLLGFLLLRAVINSRAPHYAESALALAVVLGFLYGVTDEVHQYFVPNRTASFFDVLADGLGSFIGAYIRRDFWHLPKILR